MNYVKSWGQQIDEQHDANQQQNGDGGKTAAALMKAQTDAKIKEAGAAQKRKHSDLKFIGDQKRKNVQTAAEIQRQRAMTTAQVQATDMTTAANIRAKKHAAFSEDGD